MSNCICHDLGYHHGVRETCDDIHRIISRCISRVQSGDFRNLSHKHGLIESLESIEKEVDIIKNYADEIIWMLESISRNKMEEKKCEGDDCK